jgi:hypothetical protein
MSTPDASQFALKKKYQAIQRREQTPHIKGITRLSLYVPPTSGLPDFLSSFSTKNISLLRRPLTNFSTGLGYKSRALAQTGGRLGVY